MKLSRSNLRLFCGQDGWLFSCISDGKMALNRWKIIKKYRENCHKEADILDYEMNA